jgi:hypothetical protein
MAHGRDKPRREKKKPKQQKTAMAKTARESDVLQHIAQQRPAEDPQKT